MSNFSAKVSANSVTGSVTLSDIAHIIETGHWRFATSMPEHPHEYVVKNKSLMEPMFSQFVAYIRAHGVLRHWKWGKHYVYFVHGAHEYWTMGAPLSQTTIINRALLPETK